MRPFDAAAPARAIVGFARDDEGDWVAWLACGHRQHVRHEPPLASRPWVLTPEGRASRLGATLPCMRCLAGEPPTDPAMRIDVRILGAHDADVLTRVAADVFDHDVDPRFAEAFLADPRHHIAVAIDDGIVVGFASGVDYVHPDKPRELWVNEVGVAPTHQGRGLGRAVLEALLAHGRALGCRSAWVLTERDNAAARRLYAATGGTEAGEPPVMVEFPLGGDAGR